MKLEKQILGLTKTYCFGLKTSLLMFGFFSIKLVSLWIWFFIIIILFPIKALYNWTRPKTNTILLDTNTTHSLPQSLNKTKLLEKTTPLSLNTPNLSNNSSCSCSVINTNNNQITLNIDLNTPSNDVLFLSHTLDIPPLWFQ